MKTIIYLCRHSEPIDMYDNKNETIQLRNEKISLSVLWEEKARKLSLLPELNNIDNVIASNYVRAIATAKYIAFNNKKNIEVIPEFGERKFGNINKLVYEVENTLKNIKMCWCCNHCIICLWLVDELFENLNN